MFLNGKRIGHHAYGAPADGQNILAAVKDAAAPWIDLAARQQSARAAGRKTLGLLDVPVEQAPAQHAGRRHGAAKHEDQSP